MTVPVVKQRGACAATESRLAETIALTESPQSVNPMATDPEKRNRNVEEASIVQFSPQGGNGTVFPPSDEVRVTGVEPARLPTGT